MRALAKEPGLRRMVEVISADLVALPESSRPPDVVWLHLFYHDLHTALLQTRGATRPVSIKPSMSGSSLVGFTSSLTTLQPLGTGICHAESLHRIEPAAVRQEVETAGFVLDAESTVLANNHDPHSIKVFDPSIKGETDRFAYRFVRL